MWKLKRFCKRVCVRTWYMAVSRSAVAFCWNAECISLCMYTNIYWIIMVDCSIFYNALECQYFETVSRGCTSVKNFVLLTLLLHFSICSLQKYSKYVLTFCNKLHVLIWCSLTVDTRWAILLPMRRLCICQIVCVCVCVCLSVYMKNISSYWRILLWEGTNY